MGSRWIDQQLVKFSSKSFYQNPVHQVLDLHNLDAMDVHKAYHIRVLKRHENLFNECLRMYTKREEKSVKEESKEEQQSATAQSKGRTLRKREPVAPAVRDSQEGKGINPLPFG